MCKTANKSQNLFITVQNTLPVWDRGKHRSFVVRPGLESWLQNIKLCKFLYIIDMLFSQQSIMSSQR